MPQNPTIRDVAREAGVSAATASLALRNDTRLRKTTCEKVQRVAEKLGYHTNAVVSQLLAQLRTSRSPQYQATLGMINVSDNPNAMSEVHTFREWRKGYIERAKHLGYNVDEFWLHELNMSPHRLAEILHSRNIRGVLVAACHGNSHLPQGFVELFEKFACVVIGVHDVRPLVHLACNDQFSTARMAFEEAMLFGYTRPALAISEEVDDLLESRFLGAFLAAQSHHPAKNRVPPFSYHSPLGVSKGMKIGTPDLRRDFGKWFERYQPDVIFCIHDEVKEWVEGLKRSVPRDVGLVHLDWNEEFKGWAGMNQNNHLVGAASIDMIVGQLHRNELGIPSFPKCITVESSWIIGNTVRNQAAPKKKK